MKKQFLSMAAVAALALGISSCSNNANESASTDSSSTTTTTTATTGTDTNSMSATSTGNYAAMADSVERNSEAGYYLNPKTGKPYGKLTVDRSSGRVTTEAGEPVWRYVDNRSWWVYGYDDSNWNQVGEAELKGDKLMYKGDGDKWVDYNTKWSKEDQENLKKWKESDNGNKVKAVTEDGDKIKVKTDEEGNTKIKVNDEKIKVDSNGNVKKH